METAIEDRLITAARDGDAATLDELLATHPERIVLRAPPYDMTLLHLAAKHASSVEVLLRHGADVHARDSGDNTFPIHWAAAAGAVDAVERLIAAGSDVLGAGDDHALEVIGWASCWQGGDDAAHRRVVELLVARGARHHVFSAIALDLEDELRRIVAREPAALSRRMSHNENQQLPLHFAVRMQRRRMVELLIELGADPLGVDGSGFPVAAYAETPGVDRPVMEAIGRMTMEELQSAAGGRRPPRATASDFIAAVALEDWDLARRLLDADASLHGVGALHLMAKRGALASVHWLLANDADPSSRWNHWDSSVTPLHLAILADHAEVVQALLDAGADSWIRDSKHDSDARGWAEFFGRREILPLLP